MRSITGIAITISASALTLALSVSADDSKKEAYAQLKDRDGTVVGTAQLKGTPNGVLLEAQLHGIPAGERAIHIHETGRCDPPDFESAGGHFSPRGHQHGFLDAKGPHAGDLPNVHVASGTLAVEYLVAKVTISEGPDRLLDDDGAAIVVHERPDDYRTNPAGDAGPRIACGVVAQR